MSDYTPPPVGTLMTIEHTSDNADQIRDFYSTVMGWQVTPMPMGDYDDFVMTTPDGNTWVAGICFRRGPNENQPPGWIPCFRVESAADAIRNAESSGGKQFGETRDFGEQGQYALIQDPNGHIVAVMEVPER